MNYGVTSCQLFHSSKILIRTLDYVITYLIPTGRINIDITGQDNVVHLC